MEIKDQAFGILPVEMKTVDADPGFNIKEVFPEGNIIFKLEILF
ncbi:MAG: hypothetical protein ABIT05_06010 [Chitinophagaceae bacterium]